MWRRAGSRIEVIGFGLLSVCKRIATKVEQFLNALSGLHILQRPIKYQYHSKVYVRPSTIFIQGP